MYSSNFFADPGLTVGQYFALASGVTSGASVFAGSVPFEIVSPGEEPFWLGVSELREFIQADSSDHSRDSFYKQCLQSAMSLVEGYTRRSYAVRGYNELYEVKRTDRVLLKNYPVISISGLTATVRIVPRSQTQVIEMLTGDAVPFHYLLDDRNGILRLTDMAGFDQIYDQLLISISYYAGFTQIPDAVRHAAFSLASKLINLATTEGISSLRLADLSFAMKRELFEGEIANLLAPFKAIDVSSYGVAHSGQIPSHSW